MLHLPPPDLAIYHPSIELAWQLLEVVEDGICTSLSWLPLPKIAENQQHNGSQDKNGTNPKNCRKLCANCPEDKPKVDRGPDACYELSNTLWQVQSLLQGICQLLLGRGQQLFRRCTWNVSGAS